MKAARFYEKGKLVVEDIPVVEPSDDEVLINIKYCGICGTDVHIFNGDKGSSPVTPPVTLGHEFSGDVVKVGKNVRRFAVGDRVSVDPNSYCGECYFCQNGKKQMCDDMKGIGTALDGAFAEYITVPEKLVYKIADNVSYEAASMTEPLSCCLHGFDMTGVRLGDTVMVVGTGNIGLLMVQLAKHAGATTIIAVEPNERRRNIAIELGAAFGIDPLHDDTDAFLKEHNIVNIDKVIDCAGRVSTNEYSVHYAGKGATVMLFGLTGPDDEMRLKPFEVFQKELTIKGSFVNPDTFERAGRLLSTGIISTDKIITDIVPLSDIQEAFATRAYAKNGKMIIKCS